ncbi:hypothetical protein LPJ54_003403 [Coemansia sp. RSA 1824]|nr:hypothetical protein LPJ54_003403 [Coemansia sp. RSA 1824]
MGFSAHTLLLLDQPITADGIHGHFVASTLLSLTLPPTHTMADLPRNPDEYEDCRSCKAVGAAAMTGVSLYALHMRKQLDPVKFARRRQGILGISIVCLCMSGYRLMM